MLKKRMDMIFLNIKDLKSFKYYYIKLKFKYYNEYLIHLIIKNKLIILIVIKIKVIILIRNF